MNPLLVRVLFSTIFRAVFLGAESGGNVFGELRVGGGVDGLGAREGFELALKD